MVNNLVSVCIPVYNGEQYLEDCLNSVLSQTYKHIEVIIIDDGSNDNSINIIKKIQALDSRIRLVINDTNLGLVGNWNKCIEEANGNWIKFIFQDDVMNPLCIEKMIFACEKNNVKVCICSREFIIEDTASDFLKDFFYNKVFQLEKVYQLQKKLTPGEVTNLAKDKLFSNFIGEPIVLLFHKDIIRKFGNYNADLVQLVDYEFALRICLNIDSFFLPEKLVQFRIHSDSASNNQHSDNLKYIKNQFVEPIVMYHEYNFNAHYKLLRRKYGAFKLYKEAFFFYLYKKPAFSLPENLEKYLFQKYKGLKLLKLSIPIYLVLTKLKKFFSLK